MKRVDRVEKRRYRAEKRPEKKISSSMDDSIVVKDVGCEYEIQPTQGREATENNEVNYCICISDTGSQYNLALFCVEKFECDPQSIHFYAGLEN